MHGRGGFEQEGLLDRSWSVIVDVVCLAIVIWIASGLYMWWGLPGSRNWGWIAIVAGVVAFVFFTVRL
jgi:predicted permease